MSVVLGINAVFHDPAAAIVVDGEVVAAAEEERFTRRKHGKQAVPFSTWELPEQAAAWCLEKAGLTAADLDAVAYSYDPALVPAPATSGGTVPVRPPAASLTAGDITADDWEPLRTLYAQRAPSFLRSAFPGLDPDIVRFVPHHLAHAASTALAAPFPDSAVLVCDGRGEARSHWAGLSRGGDLQELAAQPLPDSLGLWYEEVTEHLGFRRSSDEYKVMAMAAYGQPAWIGEFRELVYPVGDGGFRVRPVDWGSFVKRVAPGGTWTQEHANLAATVQLRLEEVLLSLTSWLHQRTGQPTLTMAGGVALNCVANSRLLHEGPFERIWVQPAAGDAGTALGGALYVAHGLGDQCQPMPSAALGRGWADDELAAWLDSAAVAYERPRDVAAEVARALARNQVVAWFQGRAEYGPRALGHRSLLAHPGFAGNLERLNSIKGREQFRPVAPMVRLSRAREVFDRGPVPSPYMLFTHQVSPQWRDRLPAVTFIDGSARAQTIDPADEPLVDAMLAEFERLTGLPAVVNTSLNTAGRPMVDDPRDALECFGSAPVDLLALGPFLVRRPGAGETERRG